MRIKNFKNTGFSLLEVLFASIIFTISVAGIFATLSAVRQPVQQKEKALTAAVLGQQLLESLRTQVDASTYYSSSWGLGSGMSLLAVGGPYTVTQANFPSPELDWTTINSGGYTLEYTVTCADGSTSCEPSDLGFNPDMARKVSVSVTY